MKKTHESDTYIICIQGHLTQKWLKQFDDMTATLTEDGTTELVGIIVDQSALYGLIRKIRNIGAELISVNRINVNLPDETS